MARSSRSPRRSLTNFGFDMALRDMKSERRTNPFPKAPSVSCRMVTQEEAVTPTACPRCEDLGWIFFKRRLGGDNDAIPCPCGAAEEDDLIDLDEVMQ